MSSCVARQYNQKRIKFQRMDQRWNCARSVSLSVYWRDANSSIRFTCIKSHCPAAAIQFRLRSKTICFYDKNCAPTADAICARIGAEALNWELAVRSLSATRPTQTSHIAPFDAFPIHTDDETRAGQTSIRHAVGPVIVGPFVSFIWKNVAIKKGFRRPFPSSSKDGLSSRRPFSPSSARPIAWVLDCFFGWRSSQTLSSRAIVSALEEPEEKKSGNTSSQHLRRPGNKLISN